MIVLLFATTPRDESLLEEYERANARQREIAEETPGFVSWREWSGGDGEITGLIEFETDEAVAAWRDHPDHIAAQRRGREVLYGSYWVKVCRVVREAAFTWDPAATPG